MKLRHLQIIGFIGGLVISALVILPGAGPAEAYVLHGNFSGTSMDFLNVTETTNSPGDPEILYGSPTVAGDRLLFFPTAYASSSADGSADTTSGTLQIMLQAKPGYFIETVRIAEFGDYSLTGSGDAQAQISGYLAVTDLKTFQTAEDFHSALFQSSPASGPITLSWEIDYTGLGVTAAMLTFNNNLQTSSAAGTAAFIQKKSVLSNAVQVEFYTAPVPVPAAIWLFGSALGPLCWLRRRRS